MCQNQLCALRSHSTYLVLAHKDWNDIDLIKNGRNIKKNNKDISRLREQ